MSPPLSPVTGIQNTIVGMSGGIGEALIALFSFLLAIHFEKKSKTLFFCMIGLEIAFFPFIFIGIINSILEGLFTYFYQLVFDKSVFFITLLVSMIIMSAFVVISWKHKNIKAGLLVNN